MNDLEGLAAHSNRLEPLDEVRVWRPCDVRSHTKLPPCQLDCPANRILHKGTRDADRDARGASVQGPCGRLTYPAGCIGRWRHRLRLFLAAARQRRERGQHHTRTSDPTSSWDSDRNPHTSNTRPAAARHSPGTSGSFRPIAGVNLRGRPRRSLLAKRVGVSQEPVIGGIRRIPRLPGFPSSSIQLILANSLPLKPPVTSLPVTRSAPDRRGT